MRSKDKDRLKGKQDAFISANLSIQGINLVAVAGSEGG